jgi:hypothetical protein
LETSKSFRSIVFEGFRGFQPSETNFFEGFKSLLPSETNFFEGLLKDGIIEDLNLQL